jgi:hypothetical protein
MPSIVPKVHAISIEMLIPWTCKSCDHGFPKTVKAVELTIGFPPEHLLTLCAVCARQLGRDIHKVGSHDKRNVKELKGF